MVMGQLREIYDGRVNTAYGTGETIDWAGKVGFIGASTHAYDNLRTVIGEMGERFILYRLETADAEEVARQAGQNTGKEEVMRKEMSDVCKAFLTQFVDHSNKKDFQFKEDPKVKEKLIKLAALCAHGRCVISRDKYGSTKNKAHPETPGRMIKQLTQLGRGLALGYKKDTVDDQVYDMLKKVGQHLIPETRAAVLKALWDDYGDPLGAMTLSELEKATRLPNSTLNRTILVDLFMTELIQKNKTGEGENAPYIYQLSPKALNLITASEIFES